MKIGCCGRGGLHFGRSGVSRGSRGPGSRAHLLAALTLQCADKPAGHRRPHSTRWVNVRVSGLAPPPIGLACESKGSREQDAFTETKEGLTAHRPPDAPQASPETTEAGPRRIPPLVACGRRAVGAEKSPYQQHVVPYNPDRPGRASPENRKAPGHSARGFCVTRSLTRSRGTWRCR